MTKTTLDTYTTLICKSTTFKRCGSLYDEGKEVDLLKWLYKDEDTNKTKLKK